MKIDPQIKNDLKLRLKEDLSSRKRKVTITSAYKLAEEDKKEITDKFPALKKEPVTYLVDDSLIAGYIIKIGSKVTDISLKGRLQNFKNLIYEIDR